MCSNFLIIDKYHNQDQREAEFDLSYDGKVTVKMMGGKYKAVFKKREQIVSLSNRCLFNLKKSFDDIQKRIIEIHGKFLSTLVILTNDIFIQLRSKHGLK